MGDRPRDPVCEGEKKGKRAMTVRHIEKHSFIARPAGGIQLPTQKPDNASRP
jgi:hypothetical protein